MRKPLWIIIVWLGLIVVGLLIFIGVSGVPRLKVEIRQLKEENKALANMLDGQNFELDTLVLANNSLRLEIADRDLEIVQLKAEAMAYDDMVQIWDYSLKYIYFLQLKLDKARIVYPEFTVQKIMEEMIAEGIED